MASPRRLAAKGAIAACVRVAVQRAVRAASTLCWRMAGACRVFGSCQVADKDCLQQAAKACQKHCWMLPCKDCSVKHRLRVFEEVVSSTRTVVPSTICSAAEHRP